MLLRPIDRRAVLRLLTLVLLSPALPAAAEPAFVPGFEDLPLMPGLAVVPEAGVQFDKPDGRLVEAVATGAVDPGEVVAFYRKTLPQLGWDAVSQGPRRIAFRREGETLAIDYSRDRAGLMVRFFLSPR